jgi:two-component system chemotaxis response regulator CheY
VDLVITDLVMPEMEGIEFIASLRSERPEVKIVATTGGHYADILRAASHLGAHATVSKPLTPDLVLNSVRKLMN